MIKNDQPYKADIESLMPHRNSSESKFKPSKESLNSLSLLVGCVVKPSWSPFGRILLIALVTWNTALNAPSTKVAAYRFCIIGCIRQDLYGFASRPTFSLLIRMLLTTCSNLRLSCSLPALKIIARGRDSELTVA